MLKQVKLQRVSEKTLLQNLTDYVERIDTDLVSYFRITVFMIPLKLLGTIATSLDIDSGCHGAETAIVCIGILLSKIYFDFLGRH